MADYPLVTVGDRSSLRGAVQLASSTSRWRSSVVLLGLAIVIALLGILNTLLLSIYERTRELGLLRAVGLSRRGVMRMVGTESVVMAVFGCLLGIVVGVGLGAGAVGGPDRPRLPHHDRHPVGLSWWCSCWSRRVAGVAGGAVAGLAGRPAQRAGGHRLRVTIHT